MKDYLGYENARNKENAALYTQILQAAWGTGTAVLIGHHLSTEANGDLNTENEIPSADTLMFDHDIMRAVFGGAHIMIMTTLASYPAELRDMQLATFFAQRESFNEDKIKEGRVGQPA